MIGFLRESFFVSVALERDLRNKIIQRQFNGVYGVRA